MWRDSPKGDSATTVQRPAPCIYVHPLFACPTSCVGVLSPLVGVVVRAVLVLSNPRRVPVVVVQPKKKRKKKEKKKKLNDNDIP